MRLLFTKQGEDCTCDGFLEAFENELPTVILVILGSLVPIGHLCVPCILSSMYTATGGEQVSHKLQPSYCQSLMCASGVCCDKEHVPYSFGLPCVLYPLTAMQLWRNEVRRNEVIHRETGSAARYALHRQEKWSNDTIELTIIRGLWRPVLSGETEVFTPKSVKVELWNTLAEILDANQGEWVHGGSLDVYNRYYQDMIQGLIGSKDGSLCAVFRTSADSPSCFVRDMKVHGDTTVGEIFEAASKQSLQQEQVEAMSVVVVDVDSVERTAVVKSNELVGSIGDGAKSVMFSDVSIDPLVTWGEAFKNSGLCDGCRIELTEPSTDGATTENWTPKEQISGNQLEQL